MTHIRQTIKHIFALTLSVVCLLTMTACGEEHPADTAATTSTQSPAVTQSGGAATTVGTATSSTQAPADGTAPTEPDTPVIKDKIPFEIPAEKTMADYTVTLKEFKQTDNAVYITETKNGIAFTNTDKGYILYSYDLENRLGRTFAEATLLGGRCAAIAYEADAVNGWHLVNVDTGETYTDTAVDRIRRVDDRYFVLATLAEETSSGDVYGWYRDGKYYKGIGRLYDTQNKCFVDGAETPIADGEFRIYGDTIIVETDLYDYTVCHADGTTEGPFEDLYFGKERIFQVIDGNTTIYDSHFQVLNVVDHARPIAQLYESIDDVSYYSDHYLRRTLTADDGTKTVQILDVNGDLFLPEAYSGIYGSLGYYLIVGDDNGQQLFYGNELKAEIKGEKFRKLNAVDFISFMENGDTWKIYVPGVGVCDVNEFGYANGAFAKSIYQDGTKTVTVWIYDTNTVQTFTADRSGFIGDTMYWVGGKLIDTLHGTVLLESYTALSTGQYLYVSDTSRHYTYYEIEYSWK